MSGLTASAMNESARFAARAAREDVEGMRAERRGPTNWSGFAWLAGAASAVSAMLLAALGPGAAPFPIVIAAGLSCLATLAFALAAERQRRRRDAKVSSELTVLSERLLRLEAGVNAIRSGGAGESRAAALQAGIADDVGLLSRLVGDLAETLDSQDRDIRALQARQGGEVSALPPPPSRPERSAEIAPAAAAVLDLTSREDFARTAAAILQRLSPEPASAGPEASDPAAEPAVDEERVLAALDEGRVELFLQPIVTLPQRRTRFFLAEARLRASEADEPTTLEPAAALPILRRRGRLSAFDGQALARVVAVARHLSTGESGASIICRISTDSLADPAFLEETARLFGADPIAARRLLLSIAEADLGALDAGRRAALSHLASLGPTLALTGTRILDADWAALRRAGIAVAMVDAGTILRGARPGEVSAIPQAMARAGIHLVATGVDQDSIVPDLIENEVPLAQGAALGLSRPVRTGVANPAASDSPGPAPEKRSSFRDALRRAG